ncbi:hypothetical protein OGAPHI_001825 [Ogataea philodendri]|uniref:Proteasome assembly chaperone 2 n=1 Tax=Ogataea philodendri TaxID=1378263 RepID=A0A9P8T6Q5_9ASCO|nr:uncharacterized protein OGAPHI_001825 [Ogataea philodendri]KAH3668071.1 hypothetical protein OGAPHI_001825 [Ogataea philodendri]
MSLHPVHGQDPLTALQKLEGSQLIVPVVSIGNTPQLATDLLIHTFAAKLVARLDDIYLYPFASPVDYVDKPATGITSGLEIYYCEDQNLTILQQRTPILPGLTKRFLSELIVPFINMAKFSRVLVLQSNDMGLREDKHANHKYLLWSNQITKIIETLQVSESGVAVVRESTELDGVGKLVIEALEQQPSPTAKLAPAVSGSLSLNAQAHASIDAAFLSMFVYEGDNSDDSKLLAAEALKVLNIQGPSKWTQPVSWRGVYGNKQVPSGLEFGVYA